MIKSALHCLCPHCGKASIFKHGLLSLDLKDVCSSCGLDLAKNDSADGPAVLMTFILGFSIIPLALVVDAIWQWQIWVHGVIWSVLMLVLVIGMLKPIKAYIIALQYKHRKTDWQ